MSHEEPRVLVVEVPDAADALASADADLTVRTAPGERAVERLCEGEAPDCVVLGHAPPDVDGVALFDRLREAGATVPCVLVASDPATVARALEAGVADAVRGVGGTDGVNGMGRRGAPSGGSTRPPANW